MIPVIISGGSGSRLWPVSRASYPKQFCEFYDRSFLSTTASRLSPLGQPMVVTVESMKAMTEKTFKLMGLSTEGILAEPLGKNTAPALAWLCHVLQQQGKQDQIVGVFASDHMVLDQKKFLEACRLAEKAAEKNVIVTLGIQPSYPATGYGYIEVTDHVVAQSEESSDDKADKLKAYAVKGFREKPNLATAEDFIRSKKYFWNAGIFFFRVSYLISCFEKHLPAMWNKIKEIKADNSNLAFQYASLESISFDQGIMEKVHEQVCIPCDVGWSDVGSWDEIARLEEEVPDLKSGTHAQVFTEDAHNNYVFSFQNRVVGLIGVDNLIVVETPDATLISRKGQTQKVKEVVDQVRSAGLPEATEHLFENRPWGRFEILADKNKYKAKTITVDPGQQLSYQSHAKREEHWVIVSGQAEVVLDDQTHALKAGQHIFIPKGAKHRMRNPGREPLIFVEVQTGSYFGEDDIVRYQDDYNRVKTEG